jgi:hypothetical protein
MFHEVQQYFSCEELPNVLLHHRDNRNQVDQPGFSVMEDVVKKRLSSVGIDTSHVFDPQALEYLIRMSGGVMRDMVSLVRQAALDAELGEKDLIDLPAAEQAVHRIRRQLEATLFEEHYRALQEIEYSDGRIDKEESAQKDLLRDGYVVNYENGGFWRDIHPLVQLILADYKARQHGATGLKN